MGVVYERERESEEAGETLRMDLLYQQEREFDLGRPTHGIAGSAYLP